MTSFQIHKSVNQGLVTQELLMIGKKESLYHQWKKILLELENQYQDEKELARRVDLE